MRRPSGAERHTDNSLLAAVMDDADGGGNGVQQQQQQQQQDRPQAQAALPRSRSPRVRPSALTVADSGSENSDDDGVLTPHTWTATRYQGLHPEDMRLTMPMSPECSLDWPSNTSSPRSSPPPSQRRAGFSFSERRSSNNATTTDQLLSEAAERDMKMRRFNGLRVLAQACGVLTRPTNSKLRATSLFLALCLLAVLGHMVYFVANTPTLSVTLIVLTVIWGLLMTPIMIYTFFLWTKQTQKAPSGTSFGLKVTWQLDWFVEWKYRLILMLLLTNFIFQQALTTFVVQSSGTFITTVTSKAFGENPFTAALIPTVGLTTICGIVLDVRLFYFHTNIIKCVSAECEVKNNLGTGKRRRQQRKAHTLLRTCCYTLCTCTFTPSQVRRL